MLSYLSLRERARKRARARERRRRSGSTSIPFNTAEGAAKTDPADKQTFYAIARGSAMECGAVLGACKVLNLNETDLYEKGKNLLTRIVSMLKKCVSYRASFTSTSTCTFTCTLRRSPLEGCR